MVVSSPGTRSSTLSDDGGLRSMKLLLGVLAMLSKKLSASIRAEPNRLLESSAPISPPKIVHCVDKVSPLVIDIPLHSMFPVLL